MSERVRPVQIVKSSEQNDTTSDLLVVEEPLEIRIGYGQESDRQQYSLSLTMRTPGDDEHLCLGFMYAEGIISSPEQVLSAKYCQNMTTEDGGDNIMRIELRSQMDFNPADFKRNFYTNSSCGVCGKASIEQVQIRCAPLKSELQVSAKLVQNLVGKLLQAQDIFKHTGGVHACGLFNPQGELLIHKEDVGRHNALDKLIGSLFIQQKLPVDDGILLLSGRISFELVQKAAMAGIAIIAAVGAPSSLAVELADQFGITLIGFLKNTGFNIYTNTHRVIN